MRSFLLPTILFFLSSWSGILCQDIWSVLDYQTTNTGGNGLIGKFVMSFLKHDDGSIWIGTASGISIKEGSQWSSLTMSDGLLVNEVSDMVQANDGSIWIGYGSYHIGISRIKNGEFTHYKTNDGLLHDKTEDIFIDSKNRIWVANMGGLNMYDGQDWYSYSLTEFNNGFPTSITESSNGNLWLGTSEGALCIFNGQNFNKQRIFPSGVNDVHSDTQDRIWVSSSGLHVLDDGWTKINLGANPVIWDINHGSDGSIYLSSSQGLFTLDKDNHVTHYTTNDGIPHEYVFTSYEIDQTMFIGTENGYAYYNGFDWTSSSTSDGGLVDNDVDDIFQDSKGRLWFCTHGGISRFDGIGWKSFQKTDEGEVIEWVKSGLEDTNGDLWFTTINGIFKYDGNNWQTYTYLDDNMFNTWGQDILQDKNGDIWVATLNYLLRYDGSTWHLYDDTSGFTNRNIDALYEDSKGILWIGSRSQISTWDGLKFTHTSPSSIYTGGAEKSISSFTEEVNGNIIASTKTGAYVLKGQDWSPIIGTPAEWQFDSFTDLNGITWFATRTGLGRYDGSSYQLFTEDDGLSGNVVQSVYRNPENGNFWIGTTQGITHIITDIHVKNLELSSSHLRIQADGISKPFHYSIDGNNFNNTTGEFNLVGGENFNAYITNSYDTLTIENVRTEIITGLENPDLTRSTIYPNPTRGIIKLKETGIIRVFDSSGKMIFSHLSRNEKTSINLTGHKDGNYIVQIVQPGITKAFQIIKDSR